MRLKPYTRKGEKKQDSRTKYRPPEMADRETKLEVKNANRSLKKGYRQELKQELDEEVEEYLKKKDDGNKI